MAFYTKLWGDVSLHEALNGQVGSNLARDMRMRGRNEHKDWAAGHRIKQLVNDIRGAAISGRGELSWQHARMPLPSVPISQAPALPFVPLRECAVCSGILYVVTS